MYKFWFTIMAFLSAGFVTVSCQRSQQKDDTPPPPRTDKIVGSITLTDFPAYEITVTPRDDSADAHFMIQDAIDACTNRGGGTVCVKPGSYYLKGPLFLKSNVNLHIEEGASLTFSGHVQDFLPVVLTRWEGSECFNYSPMIYAYHCSNIALTGKGTINAQAGLEMTAWVKGERNLEKESAVVLHEMARQNCPLSERMMGVNAHLRPSMIQFIGCSRVLIEDVRLRESPFWTIHPLYCDNVIVRGVDIESYYRNNDGVTPESSSNILIEHCNFRTGGDAIGVKAGRNEEGRRIGRSTENIVIRDCFFDSRMANGLCIGSEVSGGISNIFMERVHIGSVGNAIYIKSNSDRGGFVRDIFIRDITVKHARGAVFRVDTDYYDYEGDSCYSIFRDFYISEVKADSSDLYAIFINGNEANHVGHVDVHNFTVAHTPRDYYVCNSDDVHFCQVTVADTLVTEYPVAPADTTRQECDVW